MHTPAPPASCLGFRVVQAPGIPMQGVTHFLKWSEDEANPRDYYIQVAGPRVVESREV